MSEAQPKRFNLLEAHASAQPEKLAVIGSARSLTYGELHQRSRALAKQLYGLGLRPGDQAAVMTYNMPEYDEISKALDYLQVGMVMIGYRMKPPEIEFIVENSDSKMLLFWHEFSDRILPFKDRYRTLLPDGFVAFGGSADGARDYEDLFKNPPEVDLEELSASQAAGQSMIYTSGTTGKPKGAARSTNFAAKPEVVQYVMKTIDFLEMGRDEVHLVCCPLYHSAPSFFNLISFILGGTAVYQQRFDPVGFLELVDRHKVTSVHLVPTMVVRLLQVPDHLTDRLDLSSLRTVICGAAPLFPEYKLAFLDRFGDCLYEYYGATETGLNTLITPQEMRERPASVGRAFADNDIKILDEEGKEVPEGERGILYVHNAMLMEGYYKNERATVETYRGRHMTVGDVAVRDPDGYIYIVDRVKDMIIRGGVNIYPAEIEEVLAGMAGVGDAAVVGQPDPELGESAVAFVVPTEGAALTERQIQDYCGLHLASEKIPASIVFIEEIPRTPTGKILKRELREMLGETRD